MSHSWRMTLKSNHFLSKVHDLRDVYMGKKTGKKKKKKMEQNDNRWFNIYIKGKHYLFIS